MNSKINIKLRILLVILIVFAAGCISTGEKPQVKQGLKITADPDPQTIFEGSFTNLHFDIVNLDDKDYYNSVVQLFNTGIMQPEKACQKQFGLLRPDEMRTYTCKVGVGKTNKRINQLNYRGKFRTYVLATPKLKLISEDEYLKRRSTGKLENLGKTFSFEDNNLRITVTYSEDLPIIDEKGRVEYMYIDIENIGNGYVDPLPQSHIRVLDLSAGQTGEPFETTTTTPQTQAGGIIGVIKSIFQISENGQITPKTGETREQIFNCDKPEILNQIGGQFTRITCPLPLNGKTEFIQSRQLLIAVLYDYEVRGRVNINIEQKG